MRASEVEAPPALSSLRGVTQGRQGEKVAAASLWRARSDSPLANFQGEPVRPRQSRGLRVKMGAKRNSRFLVRRGRTRNDSAWVNRQSQKSKSENPVKIRSGQEAKMQIAATMKSGPWEQP